MIRDSKYGLISALLVFITLLSLIIIALPAFAAETATPPDNYVSVAQGGLFLLRGSITFDDPANPGEFVWGPVGWNHNGNADENFCLENTPSVYWSDGTPVENVSITEAEYATSHMIDIRDNGDKIARDGTFYIDIWLRAASGDGTPHKAENQWISFALDIITLFEPGMTLVPAPPIYVDVFAAGVTVSISPDNKEGWAGENLNYTVTVTNTGAKPDNYTLIVEDDLGWTKGISPPTLSIDNGENKTATLWVIVGSCGGCTDNIMVTADGVYADNSDNCTTIQKTGPKVKVEISPGYQSALPGENLYYTVVITNAGTVKDNYALENIDTLGWGLSLSKSLLENMENGTSENVTLTVAIPENATGCTWDNIWVKATSMENSDIWDNENCRAHAAVVRRVDVSISPSLQDALPGTTLSYTVTVTNTGSLADNYSLVAHDNLGWGPTVLPTSLSVPAGESRTATLSVTVPGNAARCTRDNVIVTATSLENAEVSDNDTCVAHALGGVFTGDYLKIGITENGEFGTPLPAPGTGFQYPIGDNYESLAVGTWLDGYLVAYDNEIYTHYPEDSIVGTLIFVSERTIVNTSDLAEHEVVLKTGDNRLRLNFLFQFPKHTKFVIVKATITNISGGTLNDVYYKRVMDWDVWAPTLGYNNWWGWDEDHDLGVAFLTPAETGDRYVYMGTAGYPSPTGYDLDAWDDTDIRGFGSNHDITPITSPILEDYCLGLHWSLGDLPPNESVSAYAIYAAADTLSELRANVDSALNIITPPPPPPAPAVGVSVSISPSSRSGTPGTTLTYTVTVRNTGEARDNFDLRISGGAGWSPGISPSSLTLAAGASGTATLTVTVPSGAAEGNSATITVAATSRADPSVRGSASCKATASAPPAGPGVPPPAVETPGLAIAVMVGAVATIVLSLGYILLRKS